MKDININLGKRSHKIIFTEAYSQIALSDYINAKQVLLVSNTKVAPLYLTEVQNWVKNSGDFIVETLILPDGEEFKNLETLNSIWTKLLELNFNRDCAIIALGGGVIGDMAGFAAATYQRGASFIQIPTTLLAMVDSSIGGKTGVNHALGKNMLGAFFQPKAIVINPNVLQTLPDREFRAGLGEIIKYGLLGNADFFDWLEINIQKILNKDTQALEHCIYTSCNAKVKLVQSDETEAGARALLNLGHTYGHAIETFLGYGKWLHGEAVSCGLVLAAMQSAELGWLNAKAVLRIKNLLQIANLPIDPPENMRSADFIQAMQRDKKNRSGKQKLVLLQDIGDAVVVDNVNPQPMLVKILG